jgi:hypothetical protein
MGMNFVSKHMCRDVRDQKLGCSAIFEYGKGQTMG